MKDLLYLTLSKPERVNNPDSFQHKRIMSYCNIFDGVVVCAGWFRLSLALILSPILFSEHKISKIKACSLHLDGLIGVILKNIYRKPLVIRCGGEYNYKNPIKNFISKQIQKIVLRNADKIVVNSQFLKDKLKRKDIVVVHNGVEKSKFKYKQHTKFKGKLLYVGRCREDKGLKYLLRAIQFMFNCKLIVCGEGNYKPEQHNVKYLGNVSHKRLKEIMDESDLMILPTTSDSSESFPNVILESISSGLPVLASDVAGIKEMKVFTFREKDWLELNFILLMFSTSPRIYEEFAKCMKNLRKSLISQKQSIIKVRRELFGE